MALSLARQDATANNARLRLPEPDDVTGANSASGTINVGGPRRRVLGAGVDFPRRTQRNTRVENITRVPQGALEVGSGLPVGFCRTDGYCKSMTCCTRARCNPKKRGSARSEYLSTAYGTTLKLLPFLSGSVKQSRLTFCSTRDPARSKNTREVDFIDLIISSSPMLLPISTTRPGRPPLSQSSAVVWRILQAHDAVELLSNFSSASRAA